MLRRDSVAGGDSVFITTIPATRVDSGLVKPESAVSVADSFSPDDTRCRLLSFFLLFSGLLSFHATPVSL